MRHFLAYGNSDQASFRDPDVRGCFDFMTVPGTIASYYEDATAAFVLTADMPYLVDPRTPLFQDTIHSPRASHYTLARWLGIDLESRTYEVAGRSVADFPPSFYTEEQVRATTNAVIELQLSYGGRSVDIQAKLDRYRALMQEALGAAPEQEEIGPVRSPDFVLAPYFMSSNENDPWWPVNERIWSTASEHAQANRVSPVIAVTDVGFLPSAMEHVPKHLAETRFFWISDFDERRVDRAQLASLATAVTTAPAYRWVNLYGGFFSIALRSIGLWGFSNGLGYSESRAWPQLEATGGSPPRYYVPRLHTFMSVANAQLLLEQEPWFFEPIASQVGDLRPIPTLSYHQLKRDFALSRRWEIDQTSNTSPQTIAESITDEVERYGPVASRLPTRLRIDTDYLERWADVLRGY